MEGFLRFSVAQKSDEKVNSRNSEIDSLINLRQKVIDSPTDSGRILSNEGFILHLENFLQREESYKINFDSVKQFGVLSSPDNAFRMLTWNLPMNDETNKYYCYIQTRGKGKNNYMVFKLQDKSDEIKLPERKTLGKENWFGMLYYQIIPESYKKKTYYTLLGWDGNNSLTRKKGIEVMWFDRKGEPKFGENIFLTSKGYRKRVFFEYSSGANMSVKYNKEKKKIIFDHLSPSEPAMEGMYQYYGPDLSYDAFEWKEGKWQYQGDVDVRSEESNPIYNPEIKDNQKPIYSPDK